MRARGWLIGCALLVLPACGFGSGGGRQVFRHVDDPVFVPVSQEFRIVDWNVSGLDPDRAFPEKDVVVALLVVQKALAIDANVITLQEATDEIIRHLEYFLGASWNCYAWSPGVDYLVTCVKGEGMGFVGTPLSGTADLEPNERWWGYTEVEYLGEKITNVHTRCGEDMVTHVCVKARDYHVPELHEHVKTGILAGDFNHETPEAPDWWQTDPDPEYTLRTRMVKVDHVLTVDPPISSWGNAADEAPPYTEISNHRALLTGVTLPTLRP